MLASAGVAAVNVIGTIVAGSILDNAGRKPLLTGSFLGMGASMLVLAAGMTLPALAPISGAISVLGTLAYVACFALGAGPVPALLVSELAAERVRGRVVAFAMLVHWALNFLVGLTFLAATQAFGVASVYLGFALVCGLVSRNLYWGRSAIERVAASRVGWGHQHRGAHGREKWSILLDSKTNGILNILIAPSPLSRVPPLCGRTSPRLARVRPPRSSS